MPSRVARMASEELAPYRGFHCWRGVSGLVYGRRPRTSPPVVIRAESLDDLRAKIDAWHEAHPAGQPYRYLPAPL